jgi:eukaryotic-like serine/threonine-protein kinase
MLRTTPARGAVNDRSDEAAATPNTAGQTPLPLRLGRFDVKRAAGHGATSEVFLAYDAELKREVAVKIVRRSLDLAPAARKRWSNALREQARATAAFVHPNTCAVHQIGEDLEFGAFVVSDYIRGVSLRERFAEGELSLSEVSDLATALGDALGVAAETGILHRGLRPENVRIGRFGPVITDFGLAPLPATGEEPIALEFSMAATLADQVRIARYTSPEVLSGGAYSERSDQYALAVLLAECLLGRTPEFDGEGVLLTLPLPAYDDALAQRISIVLRRGCAVRAEHRFPTCRDLAMAVATLATTQAAPASLRFSLSGAPRESGNPGRLSTPPERLLEHTARDAHATRRMQNISVGLALVVLIVLFFLRKQEHQNQKVKADAGSRHDAGAPHP